MLTCSRKNKAPPIKFFELLLFLLWKPTYYLLIEIVFIGYICFDNWLIGLSNGFLQLGLVSFQFSLNEWIIVLLVEVYDDLGERVDVHPMRMFWLMSPQGWSYDIICNDLPWHFELIIISQHWYGLYFLVHCFLGNSFIYVWWHE